MMKPNIFKRGGLWNAFIPALNWVTPGYLATGTFAEVARQAAGYWRFETERLARRR